METNKCKEKRNLQKHIRRLFCNKRIPMDTSMQKLQRVSAEWFYYYENWLVTAKWLGGGIHRGKKE